MSLPQTLLTFCQKHTQSRCVVAMSGGLDSTVLLDLCHQIQSQTNIEFLVAHANHGLSPNALDWANHCKELAEKYCFNYRETHLDIDTKSGDSLEEVARNKRYDWLASIMQDGDLLLSGHHQDDQAETFLLQLMRGAGPKGLSAMPQIKTFAKGKHGRPLLTTSRDELRAYAEQHQLVWVDDESNKNHTFARNFVRHEVLSRMKSRWPEVSAVISNSASLCAENQQLLNEVVIGRLAELGGKRPNTLSVDKLLTLSDPWQRQVLRTWICQQGFDVPHQNALQSIQRSVLTAARDKMPVVKWRDVEVRRHLDDIFVVKSTADDIECSAAHAWDLYTPIHLEGIGELRAKIVKGNGVSAKISDVRVRFRQPGEVVSIKGRGRLSLKNLFQEWQVPTWERQRIPLVVSGDELVAAVGYYTNPAYLAAVDEDGVEITLMRAG